MLALTEPRVAVVLDGRPRQKWRRIGQTAWALDGVWPSRREKEAVTRTIRPGRPLLVVRSSPGEHVDLYDEEITDRASIAAYITADGLGITSLFIPSLDWMPARLACEAVAAIDEHEEVCGLLGTTASAVLSPPLGRRESVRVLHAPTMGSAPASPALLSALAQHAFPAHPPERTPLHAHPHRSPRHRREPADHHRHDSEHR